jgi:hypothetical protein
MSNKINPFNLKEAISDQQNIISKQTNLGPRDFSNNNSYMNNMPERNISLADVVRAASEQNKQTGELVVIGEDKYLLTEDGFFLLTEDGTLIQGDNI